MYKYVSTDLSLPVELLQSKCYVVEINVDEMINGWSEVNRTDLIMSDFILWKAKRNTTILSSNTDSFHQNHGYYLKKKKFQKLILALVFSTQIKF